MTLKYYCSSIQFSFPIYTSKQLLHRKYTLKMKFFWIKIVLKTIEIIITLFLVISYIHRDVSHKNYQRRQDPVFY